MRNLNGIKKIALLMSLVLVVSGCNLFGGGETTEENTGTLNQQEDAEPQQDSNGVPVSMQIGETQADDKSETVSRSNNESQTAAMYLDYSAGDSTSAISGEDLVLYFGADWCPTCKQFEAELADEGTFATLPKNLKLVRVDYDDNDYLKDQYDIVTQHTFVQVDARGNEVQRWTGGGVSELNSRL